jgi:hypothetical protein
MHSPEIHTMREIVNYSKEDPLNVVHLHSKASYNLVKERGTDERFWTFFHQGWYQTVLYPNLSPVVKEQYVDIKYMKNKKDMHFNRILEACDLHGIIDLLRDVPPLSKDGQSKLRSLRGVITEVMMHNISHTRIKYMKCSES